MDNSIITTTTTTIVFFFFFFFGSFGHCSHTRTMSRCITIHFQIDNTDMDCAWDDDEMVDTG
jgi:hypothetical protein